MDSKYTVKRIDQMERCFGGAMARARAELGVTAFGLQVIDLPPNSGDLAPEHDHAADGQEEVYAVLAGSGELALPDRAVGLDPGVLVAIAPGTRRRLRSGPDGLRVLAIGGTPGRGYEPSAISELGGPEQLQPGASTAAVPGSAPPQLTT